uniref:Uncharacterized protein n=1 Tax=Ditylenchus dipsaci TaxID=166011 RepID=A0A915CSY6_9BILA
MQLFKVIPLKFGIFQRLSLPIPDLAPFGENERLDALGGLDTTRREYIRSLFSTAFYDEKCHKSTEIVIQPVYYWPGQRVDLPCRMCNPALAFNGQLKSWRVKRLNIARSIGSLQSSLQKGATTWVLLDGEESVRKFLQNEEKYKYMPSFDPKSDGKRWQSGGHNLRPTMSFVQRDGMLKILTTEVSAYGLYTCMDQSKQEEKLNPGRGGDLNKFARLDSNHRFRFVPPALWNSSSRPFCAPDWGDCKQNKFQPKGLNMTTSETFSDKYISPKLTTSNVSNPSATAPAFDMNLKVFVHWSTWSSCKSATPGGIRTRKGYCHIAKVDSTKKFRPTFEENLFISSRDYEWLMPLHTLIENVEEFAQTGVPLFSGVLAELLTMSRKTISQCTSYTNSKLYRDNYNGMWRMILKAIAADITQPKWYHDRSIDSNVQIFATPCFYWNKTDGGKRVAYGYPLISNEYCP